jgi:hypothetical protein
MTQSPNAEMPSAPKKFDLNNKCPIDEAEPPAVKQTRSKEYGAPKNTQFSFESLVRMKGGEFFFAPSIPFLRGL